MLKRALLVLGSTVALYVGGCVSIGPFAKVLHDLAEGVQTTLQIFGVSIGNITGGLLT